jgi:hypothetical protein
VIGRGRLGCDGCATGSTGPVLPSGLPDAGRPAHAQRATATDEGGGWTSPRIARNPLLTQLRAAAEGKRRRSSARRPPAPAASSRPAPIPCVSPKNTFTQGGCLSSAVYARIVNAPDLTHRQRDRMEPDTGGWRGSPPRQQREGTPDEAVRDGTVQPRVSPSSGYRCCDHPLCRAVIWGRRARRRARVPQRCGARARARRAASARAHNAATCPADGGGRRLRVAPRPAARLWRVGGAVGRRAAPAPADQGRAAAGAVRREPARPERRGRAPDVRRACRPWPSCAARLALGGSASQGGRGSEDVAPKSSRPPVACPPLSPRASSRRTRPCAG